MIAAIMPMMGHAMMRVSLQTGTAGSTSASMSGVMQLIAVQNLNKVRSLCTSTLAPTPEVMQTTALAMTTVSVAQADQC